MQGMRASLSRFSFRLETPPPTYRVGAEILLAWRLVPYMLWLNSRRQYYQSCSNCASWFRLFRWCLSPLSPSSSVCSHSLSTFLHHLVIFRRTYQPYHSIMVFYRFSRMLTKLSYTDNISKNLWLDMVRSSYSLVDNGQFANVPNTFATHTLTSHVEL